MTQALAVDLVAGIDAQCAAQFGGHHCAIQRGDNVIADPDLDRPPAHLVNGEAPRKCFGQ
jgi:hypothetical protein